MKHSLLPASAATMIFHGSDVLLIRRSEKVNTWPNFWAFPGGKVDDDEFFREAGARECFEEIGVIYQNSHIFSENIVMTRTVQGTKIHHFAAISDYEGVPEIRENKIADLAWFSVDALPDPMVPHHKIALQSHLNQIFYTEFNTAP